ncbi:troponin I, fast skeletal muscle-like isoform X5 [Hippoglossus hippoglossus]|nr:troponin I, fast skeletal muscle-like isoform X5 [Hippoglossus hippoglossus]
MTSSRRHHLKSVMLQIAATWIEQEKKDAVATKEAYMAETCPAPEVNVDQAALMEMCKKIHQFIDKIDDERYDALSKVQKADKEIEELKLKVVELAGVKKPALKKVRMSADAMLQALLGGKHKVTMDLRANLKQVKKEVKEEVRRQRVTGVRTLRIKPTGRRCSRPPKSWTGDDDGRGDVSVRGLRDGMYVSLSPSRTHRDKNLDTSILFFSFLFYFVIRSLREKLNSTKVTVTGSDRDTSVQNVQVFTESSEINVLK